MLSTRSFPSPTCHKLPHTHTRTHTLARACTCVSFHTNQRAENYRSDRRHTNNLTSDSLRAAHANMEGGGYPQGAAGAPPPTMLQYYSGGVPAPTAAPPPYGQGANATGPSTTTRGGTVSIWAGDLDSYMDENFLRNAVAACGWGGDITRIKVVRDRFTGAHAGYGFLDAASPDAAARVLQMGSGMPIPGSTRCWRLNMGRSGGGGISGAGSETNVYVGDLDQSVTEFQLMSAFRPRYISTRHAKVVCNDFGVSRGFGFVRFGDANEAERAVAEMQGFEFNGKPIRLSPANGRGRNGGSGGNNGGSNNSGSGSNSNNSGGSATNKRPRQTMAPDDPNNTTLFIGGTASHVNEDILWREFAHFGDIEAVRVPTNKTGFCFVRFKSRESAVRAKEEMARAHIVALNPHKPVRLEWATEQIAVRGSGPPSNYNTAPQQQPTPTSQNQPPQSEYAPAPSTYRVDPVRVPIGGHALVMPQTLVAPPPPQHLMMGGTGVLTHGAAHAHANGLTNGATAVVVAPMDSAAAAAAASQAAAHVTSQQQTTASQNVVGMEKNESEPPAKKVARGGGVPAAGSGGNGSGGSASVTEKKESQVQQQSFSWLAATTTSPSGGTSSKQ